MACCKVCCGCQDCTEGQPGKCCCGGPSGECCQTGEYCCSGACQPTPCDSGGACCTCTTNYQQWSANDKPPTVPDGDAFCTPEERIALEGQMHDAMQAIIDAAHSALTAGGWTCVGGQGDVFTDNGPNTSGDFLYSPDCELGVEVYGAAYSGLFVDAYCCGTVDTEGEPIDLGFDTDPAYPCVGPYVYDVCTDNVPAEQCCGIHHPGQTCAEEPCGDCGVTCAGVPCSELGDPACGPDCDCNFQSGECVCPTCLKCEKYFPKSELPEGQGCPDGFEEEGEGEQVICVQRTLGPRLWTEAGGTWCSENCDLGGVIEVGGVEIFYQGVCVDTQCPNPLP